jgi:hypothetical protein
VEIFIAHQHDQYFTGNGNGDIGMAFLRFGILDWRFQM